MTWVWPTGIPRVYVSKSRGHCPAHSLTCTQVNVLINHNGCASLVDFSLLKIASDRSTVIPSCIEGATIQWMGPEPIYPERFDLEKTHPTKESDRYALGMVIYEVLSGQTPFAPWRAPRVIQEVLGGGRPRRPEGEGGTLFTDDMWEMLELCWKHRPDERTSANSVLHYLEGAPSPLWPPPDMDEIVETDTDKWSGAATSGVLYVFVSPNVFQAHP